MGSPPSLETTKKYSHWMQFSFKVFLAIVAGLIVSTFKLEFIESYLYDLRTRAKAVFDSSEIKDSPTVLVMITTKTVERYQGFPQYKDHTEFLSKLYNYQPQYVLYDFKSRDGELRDTPGTDEEKILFSKTALEFPRLHILTDDTEMKGETGRLKLKEPLQDLDVATSGKAADFTLFAKDGVNRRLMFTYQNQKLLPLTTSSYYNPEIQNIEKIRGVFDVLDSQQIYVRYHKKGSFPTYHFEDIIDGKIPLDILKNKIVIIGKDTGRSNLEYVMTPFSREVTAMTSSEYYANALQTLIDNNAPIRLPNAVNIFLTVLISLLIVYTVLSLKPAKGLILILITFSSLSIVALVLFIVFGIWIDLAHPFLAIFLCYYFFIPYRLIKENRKSWEYYQKNKLLSQVEELKTNFISMMSHDLKTPIARIQGMTEVISKDVQPLSNPQREAVDTIQSSADELLKFINSILQYGRIESQGLELHKQSKDVNQILKDVVKKHEFLARVKKIKVTEQLEPLFPTQVDPDLMRQVFSNLLENAIKYSHNDSTVEIASKEEDQHIIITFKDHGVGIPSEDLPNIFMKFFRSHNAKTSTIKGSGLGLYLAHYFTELHKGKITVQSQSGSGSIFTVKLPVT